MPIEQTDPFEFVEIEVEDTDQDQAEIHRNLENDFSTEKERIRDHSSFTDPQPRSKKKYHWAFFLCTMFIGIGITATLPSSPPIGVLGGIGLGFLFFVDPIHDKVIRWLERF